MAFMKWGSLSQRLLQATIICLLLGTAYADTGLSVTYCSDQNSGSQNPTDPSIYQSLGNCQSLCKPQYAFAIVQGENCWCSNYAPGDQLAAGNCNTKCPGYPFEFCGNTDSGLFGYLALGPNPSGTISPSSGTGSPRITTPVTTQSLQTIGGSVMTRTVTLMPSTGTSATDQVVPKAKMSSGSIIAIAVAVVVAAIVLLVAIVVGVCCWRRKKANEFIDDEPTNNLGRNTSVLSKAGLLGTPASAQQSSESPGQSSSAPMSERRSSRLQVYDQRLNPGAFMQHDDGSRSSFVSMQDNRDYTRTLNVRNPDPAD